jgi:hypothetical protein
MKNRNNPLPSSATPFDPAPESPREHKTRVAEQAYAIWEQGGRTDGHALDDWLRAERQLAAEAVHAQGLRRGAGPDVSTTPPQGR